jgi:CubicO group peptidase (beta-lactamase class C family)
VRAGAAAHDGRADVAHRGLHLRAIRRHGGGQAATLPLLYRPGTRWVYSVGVDIQGYLVEKLSGQSFPDFLRTRLFEPLGMSDTGFFVPAEKMPRPTHDLIMIGIIQRRGGVTGAANHEAVARQAVAAALGQ